jgi:hypothetical protein
MKSSMCFFTVTLIVAILFPGELRPEQLAYQERTGKFTADIIWKIEQQGDYVILTSSRPNESYTCWADANLAITKWELKNNTTRPDGIIATREDNTIVIKGTLRRRAVTKTMRIDDAAWYQPIAFSLKSFITSDKPSVEFWSLNPNNLAAVKMKAEKQRTEIIELNGEEVIAQKVKVTITDFRSAFWHSYYWFNKKNGMFIRYEGVNGPPKTPKTVITLQ